MADARIISSKNLFIKLYGIFTVISRENCYKQFHNKFLQPILSKKRYSMMQSLKFDKNKHIICIISKNAFHN